MRALTQLRYLKSSSHWLRATLARSQAKRRTIDTTATALKEPRGRSRKTDSKSNLYRTDSKPSSYRSEEHRVTMLQNLAKDKGVPVMVLHKGKARLFREGAPTVYGGAVEQVVADVPPQTGDVMLLVDANRLPLGWGVYNSDSMFRLRVLQWGDEVSPETTLEIGPLVEDRIRAAVNLRNSIGLPSAGTNVYRLVNSEGDRLSGLIVDIYCDCIVAASSAAWVELNRPAIESALKHATGVSTIVWRPQTELLKLEGYTPNSQTNISGEEAANNEAEVNSASNGARQTHSEVVENGVRYKVDLRHGQKTGFYTDQRDSRALVQSLSRGKRVLDLCCYTGGFALNAAAGGASESTGVDSSAAAISLAEENAALSDNTAHTTFRHIEIERFMQDAVGKAQKWDLIILDPPKLAPNIRALPRATVKYRKLNAAAMRLLSPGGLLMTCSCSGAVAQGKGLLGMVQEAAMSVGRRPTLLRSAGAAPDHPLDPAYPEGHYMSNLLLKVA